MPEKLQTVFRLDIDPTAGNKKLNDFLSLSEAVDKKIEQTTMMAKKALNKVIHGAQLTWGIIQGVVRASGGSISMTTRLVVSAGFGAIRTLTPLVAAGFSVAALTRDPILLAQAIAGIAQLATAIGAVVAYETGAKDISRQLRGLNFTMSNINMWIGSMDFL